MGNKPCYYCKSALVTSVSRQRAPARIEVALTLVALVAANSPPRLLQYMEGLELGPDILPGIPWSHPNRTRLGYQGRPVAGTRVYELGAVDAETAVFYSVSGAEGLLAVDAATGAVTLLRSPTPQVPSPQPHHHLHFSQPLGDASSNHLQDGDSLEVVVTAIDLPSGNEPPKSASKSVIIRLTGATNPKQGSTGQSHLSTPIEPELLQGWR